VICATRHGYVRVVAAQLMVFLEAQAVFDHKMSY
jgi:hypothetical protein